jgi:uncharacterized protein (DUF1697 family)
MPKYVALLRAVNVAGHARVRGDELRKTFTAAGARDVSSYGPAGSVLFSAQRAGATICARVSAALLRKHGESPIVVVRAADELVSLVAADPFARCGARASDKLYVTFLSDKPRREPQLPLAAPLERLTAFGRHGREVLLVSRRKPNGFYGLPNALVEDAFGVPATTRNWSTVRRLAAMLGD